MLTTKPSTRTLAKDEGGAVMIMGLAMILSLIAFMWFCIGIGETVAFRDHMQDAADSAAFSQAAVEAAGMNVIVLINMLMMLLVAVYLVLSISVTASWASTVATCLDPLTWLGPCEAKVVSYVAKWNSRNSKASKISKVQKVLSMLESGVALLAPWAGTAAGVDASTGFKMHGMENDPVGLSVSANNIPDMKALNLTELGVEYGLPVTHEILGNDCSHVFDIVSGLLGSIIPGRAMGFLNKVTGALGSIVQWYYCDDSLSLPGISTPSPPGHGGWGGAFRLLIGGGDGGSYWNEKGYGPMQNFKHKNIKVGDLMEAAKPTHERHAAEQKNGADHNQSYSFLVTPGAYDDHSASRNIGLMQLQHERFLGITNTKPTTILYFAQAELYFDCMKGWRSPDCDDITDNLDRMDMTVYRFEWRARLVKFHTPAGGASTAFSAINKVLGMVTDVKAWLNGGENNPFIKAMTFLDKITGSDIGSKIISSIGKIADIPPDQVFH